MNKKYQEGGYMSEFAPMPAYQPDYKFLVSALQTQQSEYERGLNTVRNIYSSLLNKPVTSSDNQTYRNDIFKKLQTSLKDISAIDFSNPVNVSRAQSLLEPITNDQQLMYDMQVSQYHQLEKQKLESAKNSTDEKIRATYNPTSLQAISLVEDELRNAKRGENSITSIKPQKFVAFQDPIKDLDKLAKDAGLEIEIDNTDGKNGYIVKTTNGPMTVPQFTNWAKLRLGPQYDEQFAQEAFVKTESQIRNVMQEQNLSKEQARRAVATELSQNLYNQTLEELSASDKTVKDINEEIRIFEENYPNGAPSDKLKKMYDDLLTRRDEATNDLALKYNLDEKFKTEGADYIAQNLSNIVASNLKSNAAKSWANAYATTKMKYEVRPDQVVLEKWKLAQDERQFQQNLQFQRQKEAADQARWEKDYALDVAKLQQDTEIAKREGKLPSTEKLAPYKSGDAASGAVDILQESLQKNLNQTFDQTFGADNGLVQLTELSKIDGYYSVLDKLRNIANTGSGQLTNNEKNTLVKLYGRAGLDASIFSSVPLDNSPSNAQGILNNLIQAVYKKAQDNVGIYVKQQKREDVDRYSNTFGKALGSMASLMTQRDNLNANYKKIAQEIAPGGRIKPMYEGVKVLYNLVDGTPVYDVSGLDAAKKSHLANIVDKGYTNRSGVIGSSYSIKGLSEAEINLLTSPSFVKEIETDDEKDKKFTVDRLNNLSGEAKRKLFSDGVIGNYDPGSKTAVYEIKVDPSSTVAKELGIKGEKTLKIKVGYQDILKLEGSLPRLAELAKTNTASTESAGNLEPLMTNFTSTVYAPTYYTMYGFDYKVSGSRGTDGKPGLDITITFMNPDTDKKETIRKFFNINDIDNPSNYVEANNFINTRYETYRAKAALHNKK
jgi:hypothetical protein